MRDLRRLDFARGRNGMVINGRSRPAYEWCEMFGHQPDESGSCCTRCGGARLTESPDSAPTSTTTAPPSPESASEPNRVKP